MSDPDQLPAAVRNFLRGYVMRGRRLAVLRGLGVAGCIFLGTLLATAVIDRFVQFPSAVRMGLLGLAGILAIAAILRPLLQLSRPEVDWLAVAAAIEEQDNRFGQRLQTVASRMLGRGDYRGSDEILEQLCYELNREAAHDRPSRLLPGRQIAGPWLLLAGLVTFAYGLWHLPDINLPQLGLRFLMPWRAIDPVTTTRLAVLPGDQDILQGTPAAIDAAVSRLGGGLVWLHVAEGDDPDHQEWQKFPMAIRDEDDDGAGQQRPVNAAPPADDILRFGYTLTSIDRDVRYFVTAGDARSHVHVLRVLRKPAIAEFQVRYVYPAHTGRPPHTVTNTDGRLEAPAGTEAEITIVATEPLRSALLTYAGETQAMTRPPDDASGHRRTARIVLSRDGRIDLGLVSTREQAGIGPSTAEVKALPDRTPIVRIDNTGKTLRLGPRDMLPISFEAIDDFGVETLVLRAQVGSGTAIELPVAGPAASRLAGVSAGPLGGALRVVSLTVLDSRRREGLYDLDLAVLPLSVGDVLTLALAARDTSNQVTVSDAIHVLVSPRSVGIDAYELISELDAAALLATSAAEDLKEAAKRLEASDADTAGSPPSGRAGRRFMAAGSSAALVRRALQRGIGREPAMELSDAMVAWIDDAQTVSASAEAAFRELGSEPRGSDAVGSSATRIRTARAEQIKRTQTMAAQTRRLADQLRTVANGQRAAVVLADLENESAMEKHGPPRQDKAAADRWRQSLARLREDIAAAGKSLGLQPSAGNFRQKLQSLIDQSRDAIRGRGKADYLAAAREWQQQLRKPGGPPATLDGRLTVAAQAEAVRPGGDLRIARDLSLAASAAAEIASTVGAAPEDAATTAETAGTFVSALEALQREHGIFRRPTDVLKGEERAAIVHGADAARQQMERWAEASPATGPAVARTAALEAIAMRAGAAAADGNYDSADRHDAALLQQMTGAAMPLAGDLSREAMAKVGRAVGVARTIDAAGQRQQELSATMTSAQTQDAEALSAAQRQIAERLAEAARLRATPMANRASMETTSDARDKAGEAYVTAQNRLIAMPQQLADLLDADATWREAAHRTRRAREELDRVPADRKASAQRMVEMAAVP